MTITSRINILIHIIEEIAECASIGDEGQQHAMDLFMAGEPPTFSTGICESVTAGYGKLDVHGYWEFPLPSAIAYYLIDIEEGL